MTVIRPGIYKCDQCDQEFQMFILWDWVYAEAIGVEPNMTWFTLSDYYEEIEPGVYKRSVRSEKGRFYAANDLPGVLCESCVEDNLGRNLCWWDYMHIAGNFPDVDLDFFI